MARPFSYPEVKALEIGDYAIIRGPDRSGVVRKVTEYAKRCKPPKCFDVRHVLEHPEVPVVTRVTRLPDPEPRAE